MSIISANKDKKGNSGIITIDINDITFMEYDSSINRIIVHTFDDFFYTVGTLKYWINTLKCSGFNFVLADRNTLIHIANIVQMDKTFLVAYFGESLKRGTKKCFLSEKGYKEVKAKINVLDSNIAFIELPSW